MILKKFGTITAITTALVIGGGLSSVDASANTDKPVDSSFNTYDTVHQGDCNTYYHNNPSPFHFKWNMDDMKYENDNGQTDSHDTEQNQSQQGQLEDESNQNEQDADKQEQNKPSEDDKASNEQQESSKQEEQTEQSAEGLSQYEQEVVDLTNEERKKQGLSPLKADTELSEVARDKSRDMSDNNYFSHDSPNYGSPFDMMSTYGIDYQTAGENIARGQQSPEEVVDGWMNSQGHRENILNPDFTHIGVGYVEDGNYWTQEFTG